MKWYYLTIHVIPGSVKELGWGLFDGCEDIVTVYCDEGSGSRHPDQPDRLPGVCQAQSGQDRLLRQDLFCL